VTGAGTVVVGIIAEVGIMKTGVGITAAEVDVIASGAGVGLGIFLQPHLRILSAIDSLSTGFTTLLESVKSSTEIHKMCIVMYITPSHFVKVEM